MEENGILESIRGHEARNAALLEKLTENGVTLEEARPVDHHFWAPDQNSAALLAKALYERQYLVTAIGPAHEEGQAEVWDVSTQITRSPREAASSSLSEELVRLAAEFGATYDGWGTLC